MKKIIISVIALLIIALIGSCYYFIGTPTYSLYKTRKAISQHDSVTFNKYVDVDRVVSSLIEQATSSLEDDDELKDNPFKGLATALFSSMKEQLKNEINKSVEEISEGKDGNKLSMMKTEKVIKEGKSAKVTLKNSDGETINFDMVQVPERYWRVVGINLDDFRKIKPIDSNSLDSNDTSSKKEEQKISSSVKFGEKTSIGGGWFITINEPELFTPSGYSFNKPSDGNKFVTVDIEYSNESDKEGSVSPTDNLRLKDADNHSYEAEFYGGKEPELEDNSIVPARDKIRGYLTFKITENFEITKAVYSNDYATISYQ